jgi:hypothetical protein
MKVINYKYLMLECGTYKPSIDVGFSLSINNCLYIHIAFIFFYIQIDIEKENKEINAIRARRKANKIGEIHFKGDKYI